MKRVPKKVYMAFMLNTINSMNNIKKRERGHMKLKGKKRAKGDWERSAGGERQRRGKTLMNRIQKMICNAMRFLLQMASWQIVRMAISYYLPDLLGIDLYDDIQAIMEQMLDWIQKL